MRRSIVTLVLLGSLAIGCARGVSPDADGAMAATASDPKRRPPASAVDRLEGSARCRGVDEGAPLLAESGSILSRALLERTDLPVGWSVASPAGAPPPDDALFVVASAAWQPFCASARDHDTPGGRVRVLVAVFADETTATDAAGRMNATRGPDVAPAISSLRHVTLIAPGDRAIAEEWAAVANTKTGARDIDALARAAGTGNARAFDQLFDPYVAAHPDDAMPWAYRAGLEAGRGRHEAAKVAAKEALARAEDDPEAQAEAFHWAGYAEYSLGEGNAVVLDLCERGVAAARASGNEPMIMRALFGRACSLSLAGEARRAFDDVKESLAIEARLGGRYYRDAAKTDADLAAVRRLPEMTALLKD